MKGLICNKMGAGWLIYSTIVKFDQMLEKTVKELGLIVLCV